MFKKQGNFLRAFSILAFVLASQASHAAVGWGDVAFSGTLTANDLCYTDGADIICDGDLSVNGTEALEVSGTVSATAFVGDGSGLTGVSSVSGIDDLTDGIHDTDDYSSLFLGNGAGANDDGTANDNIGIGLNSLTSNTTGAYNVAIGQNSLDANVTSSSNVAIGFDTLTNATGAASNVAIGNSASRDNITGDGVIAIGSNSFEENTATQGLAIGTSAGRYLGTGAYNTILGNSAGVGSTGASNVARNTFIGYESGNDVLTGANNNVFLGYRAGDEVTTGSDNLLIGYGVDTVGGVTASNELNIGNTIYGDLANDMVSIGITVPTEELEVSGTVSATAFVGDGSGLTGVSGVNAIDDLTDAMTNAASNTVIIGHEGSSITSGTDNVSLGVNALVSLTTAGGNVAIGQSALNLLETGGGNTAVGLEALRATTGNWNNSAFGAYALTSDGGGNNSAFGYSALYRGGTNSNAFGRNALNNANGTSNSAFGYEAGEGQTGLSDVDNNVFFGHQSGMAVLTGADNNTFLGYQSGLTVTTGARNILIGTGTDTTAVTASDELNIGNTIYGDLANDMVSIGITVPTEELEVSGTVSATAFVGDGSGLTGVSGVNAIDDLTDSMTNTASATIIVGHDGSSITSGLNNVGLGLDALVLNSSGNSNTAVGNAALDDNATGSNNTAVGSRALSGNTTEANNTAFGTAALRNATAANNTAVGNSAMGTGVVTGAVNTAVGISALNNNTSGDSNSAVGGYAMTNNTTGDDSAALGVYAMSGNVSGNYNSAFGESALRYNQTGHSNVGIGHNAGEGVSTASNVSNNVFVGKEAGNDILTGGDDNTFVGYQAGDLVTTGARNILIGQSVDTIGGITASDELNVGNTIYGDLANDMVSIGIDTPTEELEVSGTVSATAFVGDGSGLTGVTATVGIDDLTDGIHDTDDYSSLFLGNGAGANDDGTDNENIGIGVNALNATITGGSNIGIGSQALALTTGHSNVAVGPDSLRKNVGGNYNVAVGRTTMEETTSGIRNTAIGHTALNRNTTGDSNVGLGYEALLQNQTGIGNVALGKGAHEGVSGNSSFYNVSIGFEANNLHTTGDRNIAIGYLANVGVAGDDQLNIGNTIYGDLANDMVSIGIDTPTEELEVSGTVSATAFVGDGSGLTGVTATVGIDDLTDGIHDSDDYSSLFLGNAAGAADDGTDNRNIGIGDQALTAVTTGANNIAIGRRALDAVTTTSDNIAIGDTALTAATGGGNNNVAIGPVALSSNTTGSQNIAIGNYSMNDNLTGQYNVALGYGSLQNSTAGLGNTAVGHQALADNVSHNNTGIGYTALSEITGTRNVGLGYAAGEGVNTLSAVNDNVFLGYKAGEAILTGADDNVFIGADAGLTVTTGARNILIGSGVETTAVGADDELNIGDTIYGDLANDYIGVGMVPTEALEVSGTAKATEFQASSDRTLKENITPLENSLENITKLEGVSYKFKVETKFDQRKQVGLIAQDVKKVFPEVVKGEEGSMSVNYAALVAPLVEAVKELNTKVERQQQQIEEQQKLINELKGK